MGRLEQAVHLESETVLHTAVLVFITASGCQSLALAAWFVETYRELRWTFVRSLTAIEGLGQQLLEVYLKYANAVLSRLESEESDTDTTEATDTGSQDPDKEAGGAMDERADKKAGEEAGADGDGDAKGDDKGNREDDVDNAGDKGINKVTENDTVDGFQIETTDDASTTDDTSPTDHESSAGDDFVNTSTGLLSRVPVHRWRRWFASSLF